MSPHAQILTIQSVRNLTTRLQRVNSVVEIVMVMVCRVIVTITLVAVQSLSQLLRVLHADARIKVLGHVVVLSSHVLCLLTIFANIQIIRKLAVSLEVAIVMGTDDILLGFKHFIVILIFANNVEW